MAEVELVHEDVDVDVVRGVVEDQPAALGVEGVDLEVLVVADRHEQLADLPVLLAVGREVDVGVDAVELGLDPAELRAVVVKGQRSDDAQRDALLGTRGHDPEGLVFEDLGQVGVGRAHADLAADHSGRACRFVAHLVLPSRRCG